MTFIEVTIGSFSFSWDVQADLARISVSKQAKPFWQGSILPSFVLNQGGKIYVDSLVTNVTKNDALQWHISFDIGKTGQGSIRCEVVDGAVLLRDLSIRWNEDTDIVAMYFGTKCLSEQQAAVASITAEDLPFWPNWRGGEYCVPCAGGSPTHSFWRCWDMGDAVLPLGSFGAGMGTPYAAAFPRPLYAFALGDNAANAWTAIGPGEVPAAALLLRIKASSGCVEYLYREDLWGAANPRERFFKEPLRMTVGANAYEAYDALFKSLGVAHVERVQHIRSICCTWGQFMNRQYDIRNVVEMAEAHMPAEVLLVDEAWESQTGSGQIKRTLFPDFEADLQYARDRGMDIGLWLSLGWIRDPFASGLDESDLLCGYDGKPRKTAWLQDPHMPESQLFYCIDPSTARARQFLKDRSQKIVSKYGISLLKLDFGYALPSPDICAPRDAAMRGECLCIALAQIIGQAAREANPDITILYYGISPLTAGLYDMISLDDMGDCGSSPDYERTGHSQRCLWAALAARHGMPINTSSGYFWDVMEDILLDTVVTGVCGTVLPMTDTRGKTIKLDIESRWLAVTQWRRRETSQWFPLFLDCDMGGSGSEPQLRSWARLEEHNGSRGVYAAALRGEGSEWNMYDALPGICFVGKWALVSLDEQDICHCRRLAVIPFSSGRITCIGSFGRVEKINKENGQSHSMCLDHQDAEKWSASVENTQTIVGFILHRGG